ncbi:MAG: substrate-binding periplasmic protein [Christensenellales bacterium]
MLTEKPENDGLYYKQTEKNYGGFSRDNARGVFTAGVFGCGRAPSDENALPVLTIASDEYQPYFYVGESGEYAGIDVELAVEACRRMGYKAKFVRIRWTEKDDVLARGEADCLWGSFSMTGREDKYLWAGPYMTSRQVVGVEKTAI